MTTIEKKPPPGPPAPPPAPPAKQGAEAKDDKKAETEADDEDESEEEESEAKGDDKAKDKKADAEEGEGDDEWRTTMANGDAQTMKTLKRYASPVEVGRALMEARRQLRERGAVPIPKADASADEIAAFRERAKGTILEVPSEAAGYGKFEPDLPDGVDDVPEEAAPFLDVVMDKFKGDLSVGQMAKARQMVVDLALASRMAAAKEAETAMASTTAEMKKEWGRNYEKNLRLANAEMTRICRQVGVDKDDLRALRLEGGVPLGSHPLFAKLMAAYGNAFEEENLDEIEENRDNAGRSLADLATRKQELLALGRSKKPADRRKYESEAVQNELKQIIAHEARAKKQASRK